MANKHITTVKTGNTASNPKQIGKTNEVLVQGPSEFFITKFMKRISKKTWTFIIVGLFLITNIIIAQAIRNPQIFRLKAGVRNATISIQPSTSSLTRESVYQIWLNVNQPIAFVQIAITFDPNSIKLTQEINFITTQLKRKIMITPMNEANATGKIMIVVGSDPSEKNPEKGGTSKFAELQFAPNTSTPNQSTVIAFNTSSLLVIGFEGMQFDVTARDATVSVNPAQTATPTSTPAPTQTINVISTPTSTPMTPSTSVKPTFYPVDLITPISTITVEKVPGINPPIQ